MKQWYFIHTYSGHENKVVESLQGWLRPGWEAFTGVAPLGEGLPEYRAGCGSRSVEPGRQ